jgi:hypothetical protein
VDAHQTQSHEQPETPGPTANAEADLGAFANWFADWWLRRGHHLTRPDSRETHVAASEQLDSNGKRSRLD